MKEFCEDCKDLIDSPIRPAFCHKYKEWVIYDYKKADFIVCDQCRRDNGTLQDTVQGRI